MKKIKNILFDLGGVLFPLAIQRTVDAFIANGVDKNADFFGILCGDDIDHRYETGTCTTAEFRQRFNQLFNTNIDDDTFDQCWYAMIINYPESNRPLLNALRSKGYNLYVLSNINELHVNYVEKLAQWPEDLFVKIYYSNEIHLAKPSRECYEYVINDSKIDPTETLYIDDRADNAAMGRQMGFQTINLPQNGDLYKELQHLL
ncbi:MAG: HAD family phosphatase [Bacteroidales bacterium]|nr:HAD family phosphatase [Bacteroidales bacterium]